MILIDGIQKEDSLVDPKIHKFIGMFRRPFSLPQVAGYICCSCGQILQSFEAGREHWQMGHWDIPQYVTIE